MYISFYDPLNTTKIMQFTLILMKDFRKRPFKNFGIIIHVIILID